MPGKPPFMRLSVHSSGRGKRLTSLSRIGQGQIGFRMKTASALLPDRPSPLLRVLVICTRREHGFRLLVYQFQKDRSPRESKYRRPDVRSTFECLLMTQCPDVCGDCRQLVGSEFRSTHGRHRAAIFLRVGHSFSDGFQDFGITAIAPEPLSRGKTWTQW